MSAEPAPSTAKGDDTTAWYEKYYREKGASRNDLLRKHARER